MMVCAGLIGLAAASLTTIAGSVASRDARSMSRLDVSMLLYLRLFVSIREPDCRIPSLRAADLGPFGRTLDFNVSSETFAVSPVPLPPALPLFAAALLALGIAGYLRRAKGVTALRT
jgi:hypothetical protein